MVLSHIASVANQFYKGAAPPAPNISVADITATTEGTRILTSYSTTGATEKNQLPIAFGVQITGRKNIGQTINGTWQYFHVNNSTQGATIVSLKQADDLGFTVNVTEIATSFPFVIPPEAHTKYYRLDITPVTIDGTSGLMVSSDVVLIGNAIVQRKLNLSLGSASSPTITDDETWNHLYTNNPDGTYTFGPLIRSDGVTTPFSVFVDLALSDNNTGSLGAGVGAASNFPANAARGYWYAGGSPARGFQIDVDTGMGIGEGEVEILSNLNSGSGGSRLQVNGQPEGFLELASVVSNPPGQFQDCVAIFEEVNMTTNIVFRTSTGIGISPINAVIVYYYEELP